MRGFHNGSFDPPTLVVLEGVFDEAWLALAVSEFIGHVALYSTDAIETEPVCPCLW
jgi:hypothetical protein